MPFVDQMQRVGKGELAKNQLYQSRKSVPFYGKFFASTWLSIDLLSTIRFSAQTVLDISTHHCFLGTLWVLKQCTTYVTIEFICLETTHSTVSSESLT